MPVTQRRARRVERSRSYITRQHAELTAERARVMAALDVGACDKNKLSGLRCDLCSINAFIAGLRYEMPRENDADFR